jgi:toxin FitB
LKLLLDTNVLSEMERPGANDQVRAAITALDPADLFISVITLGEVARGIALMTEGRRRQALAHWLVVTRQSFGTRVIAVDGAVAEEWGLLDADARRRGTPVQMAEGLIAATARVHALRVATRNVKDLLAAGAPVYDPWTSQMHESAS